MKTTKSLCKDHKRNLTLYCKKCKQVLCDQCSCKDKEHRITSLVDRLNLKKLSNFLKELNTLEEDIQISLSKIPQFNDFLSRFFNIERTRITPKPTVPVPGEGKSVFYSVEQLEAYVEEHSLALARIAESYAIIQADIANRREKLLDIVNKVQSNIDADYYNMRKEYKKLRLAKVIEECGQMVNKLNRQLKEFERKEDNKICAMCEANIGRIVLKCGHYICASCTGEQIFTKKKEVLCYPCGGIKRTIGKIYVCEVDYVALQCGCNQYIINVRNASYTEGKVVNSPCNNCKKTITSADALALFGGVSLSLRKSSNHSRPQTLNSRRSHKTLQSPRSQPFSDFDLFLYSPRDSSAKPGGRKSAAGNCRGTQAQHHAAYVQLLYTCCAM
eukprot:TRINITY_DN4062_c0_g1_i5.p1 TRINITY_DN4062_c0_g1~~TRINITY_DN4062_c0_g1_i5.p1  ORF type:complete len:387 (+),score=47.56 TRINITY_DN4062_c0_g1_i5:173-1333(+)